MISDDNGKARKMSNAPFYRQAWFIPIAILVGVILWLQVLPR